jgi:hypothetical protein
MLSTSILTSVVRGRRGPGLGLRLVRFRELDALFLVALGAGRRQIPGEDGQVRCA